MSGPGFFIYAMLTTPLHAPGWLAWLRDHPYTPYQLLGALLEHSGPRLTMYWLDLLSQYGPRTAIPGLHTTWDVGLFGYRYKVLVDEILNHTFPGDQHDFVHSMMVPPGRTYYRPSKAQQRNRRTRIAVFIAVATVHRNNPEVFQHARLYEQQRCMPKDPFAT